MPHPVVVAARSLRRALAGFEPAVFSGADIAALAQELAATEKACAAARLLAAARAVEVGAHKEAGFSDGAAWLARQGGTTTSEARQALETAAGLGSCPDTLAALLAGDVSLGQAKEITRTQRESPGHEADLVAVAKEGDLTTLRDVARERRLSRSDPDALHEAQHRSRQFRHWRDRLGMVCFTGALPPESGLPFVRRIEEAAGRARRAARAKGAVPEPFCAYAADAVVTLGAAGDPRGGPARPASAEVVVVCDLFAWRRGHAHPGEPCHLIGGGPIPVVVAKELGHDAFLKAVLHDGVAIHTVAHLGRHLRAELKTALDLGPVPAFSGRACADCGRHYGLEYDHVNPVANDGPTSYDNLQARCWADHRAKTERDRKAGLLGRRRGPPPY